MRTPWSKAETDLDREVQYHLESLADTFQSQGMSRAEAMREARREFGAVESIKEECRDQRWWRPLAEVARDLRFGWRMMRRAPAITGAALLSLALGIGATTAILSLADVLLWRTLGVPDPGMLSEVLWEAKEYPKLNRSSSGGTSREGALLVSDFFSSQGLDAMRAATAGKGDVAAHVVGGEKASAIFDGRIAVTNIRPVTGNFFEMLRVRPALGRLLTDRDDTASATPVVVLSHRFWVSQLGGASDVIGRPMRINNHVYEIAGVLPARFLGIVPGDNTEIYAPIRQSPVFLAPDSWIRERADDPLCWWLHPIVRRAPGVTLEQLRGIMDAAFATSWVMKPSTAETTPHIRLNDASRGLGSIRRELGNPLLILLGMVLLVLIAACANIANLMLARAVSREKEIALRISLGCGQGRLLKQLFTESLLLAGIGGALSIPAATAILALMSRLIPVRGGEMMLSVTPDPRSLAGTAVVTLLAAMLFGLYPAWRAVRLDAGPALKEVTGSSAAHGRSRWAPARILVLLQVSLGVVLVTAAVLFTGNLWEIVNRDTGFERGNILLFDVRPGEIGYQDDRLKQFYTSLEQRLGAVPGVEAAGLSRTRPMLGGGYWSGVQGPGRIRKVQSAIHHVSARFMDTMGVPVVAGRMLTRQEIESGAKVAVISQDVAKQLQLASPLGTRISMGQQGGEGTFEVVGVARAARYSDMERTPPVVYIPFNYEQPSATVMIRAAIPPLGLLPAVQGAVRDLNSDLPLLDVYTMEQQISRTLQRERLFAWLCGSFGVLALVLCMVGLYGLMSHTTARRTHEIGIRMAMGATRGGIIIQSLRSGLGLAAGGLILGVPPAVYAMRLAEQQKMIPEGPFPYGSLAAAIGLIALSAILAVLIPALRAASVQPSQALRHG
jgi:predicted permease